MSTSKSPKWNTESVAARPTRMRRRLARVRANSSATGRGVLLLGAVTYLFYTTLCQSRSGRAGVCTLPPSGGALPWLLAFVPPPSGHIRFEATQRLSCGNFLQLSRLGGEHFAVAHRHQFAFSQRAPGLVGEWHAGDEHGGPLGLGDGYPRVAVR